MLGTRGQMRDAQANVRFVRRTAGAAEFQCQCSARRGASHGRDRGVTDVGQLYKGPSARQSFGEISFSLYS